jgi:uncharacterized protein YcgI (DUF1989 family)
MPSALTRNADQSSHSRPFDRDFYDRVEAASGSAAGRLEQVVSEPTGFTVEVDAGELLTVELVDGPQIVNMLAFNTHDPDERFWAHQTCLIDGLFLSRWSRLWGTMARLRPLMTVIEDTVATRPVPGAVAPKHHPVLGGAGTPAQWHYSAGAIAGVSTRTQFAHALAARDLVPELIVDDACLFQKSSVRGGWVTMHPSDALTRDRLTFFAEIDLTVMLALSPFLDGSTPPDQIRSSPRSIKVTVTERVAEPVGWPYEGMGYPDLSLYLNSEGVRSAEATPTQGR